MRSELVAIIPAAGQSRRMGEPKLLMRLGGRCVITRVIETLRAAGISRSLVVVRSGDRTLIEVAREAGGEVLIPPSDPPDMRHSVEFALRTLRENANAESPCRGWVLVPADHPTLSTTVLNALVQEWHVAPSRIVVPCCGGHRGHPTIIPWCFAETVLALPPDQGINQLLRSRPESVHEVPLDDPRVLDDLDTPGDWRRICLKYEEEVIFPDSGPRTGGA